MSQPIILLLPDWVQQHITTLYSAKTADDFDTAFDAFISHKVSIKVNGKPMSRDQYKKLIKGEITNDVSADVAFNGVVSVPDVTKDHPAVVTGTVGLFFKATVFGKLFVFGSHTSSTVTSSLNVGYVLFTQIISSSLTSSLHSVSRDTSVKANDNRRVTILDEVLTDVQNPAHPPTTA
ncbi:hypothetical protein C8T65DRAFT_577422 [Cerioporus squamosus]|nr:hypothetical protein C8T65DRAFT_577422 [Cerioporus squamosus]